MIIKSDSMDANGVRQIKLQTTATGNNPEGYKAAERQAHQWFFVNYDGSARMRLLSGQSPTSIIDKAIEDGYLNPHWLDCPHPVIGLGSKDVMFGDHVGINPETPDAAWAFQFELVPTEAAKLSGVGRR